MTAPAKVMSYATINQQLPPHLREVCSLLAHGLVRLRSRAAENETRGLEIGWGRGESSLHFQHDQSGHANPNRKGLA